MTEAADTVKEGTIQTIDWKLFTSEFLKKIIPQV